MSRKRYLIGAIAALVISSLNGFGLEWETKRISIVATPEQESAEAVFVFTNNSSGSGQSRQIES